MLNILEYNNICVFFHNGGFGDAYISLPSLRACQSIFGENLTIITSEFCRSLFLAENFTKIKVLPITIVEHNNDKEFSLDMDILTEYLAGADLYIDINPWHTKIGDYKAFVKSLPMPTLGCFDFFSQYKDPEYPSNTFDTSFKILELINPSLRIEDFAYPPLLTGETEMLISKVKKGLSEDIIIIAIQDETKPAKMWDTNKFEELLNTILSRYTNVGILILGRKTLIDVNKIYENQRVLYFDSPLDFNGMVGLISIVDYFIGIDSVFLHIADLYRIPSVGLFGPTNPQEWGFRFTNGTELRHKSCKMSDITVDEVLHTFEKLIEGIPA